MSGLLSLARRYGLDALIVLAAIESVVEVVLRHGSSDAPRTTLWFVVPATASLILPLLARRRLPFVGPMFVWLLGPLVSFVDGRLVPNTPSITVAGLAAAFLLGNRRIVVGSWLGLAVLLAGTA